MRAWLTRNLIRPTGETVARGLKFQGRVLQWQASQLRLVEAQFLALQELQRITLSVGIEGTARLQERWSERLQARSSS